MTSRRRMLSVTSSVAQMSDTHMVRTSSCHGSARFCSERVVTARNRVNILLPSRRSSRIRFVIRTRDSCFTYFDLRSFFLPTAEKSTMLASPAGGPLDAGPAIPNIRVGLLTSRIAYSAAGWQPPFHAANLLLSDDDNKRRRNKRCEQPNKNLIRAAHRKMVHSLCLYLKTKKNWPRMKTG